MPKFMLTLKSDENTPVGAPPQALFEAIGAITQEWSKEGVLLDTAGLAPTAMSVRVSLTGGEISAADGPFGVGERVAAGYAIVQVDDQKAAVQRATDFLELHNKHWPGWEGQSEVRQIFGPQG